MRILLSTLLLVLLCHGLTAQDTLLLKNGQKLVAQVKEVTEDSVSISMVQPNGTNQRLKYALQQIRRIHYQSGYKEVYSKPNAADDVDLVTLVDAKTIACKVIEVGETALQVEINSRDTTLQLPLNSIATVRYGNGFTEQYNKLIEVVKPPAPAPAVEVRKEPASEKLVTDAGKTTNREAGISTEKKAANNTVTEAQLIKAEKTTMVAAEKSMEANNAKTTVTETVEPYKEQPVKKGSDKGKVDLSEKVQLGIGLVIDSTTNLSRSFALFQMVTNNPIAGNNQLITPVLTDYPFTVTDFSVTGVFKKRGAQFKLYKNGKKIKEINSPSQEWRDIYVLLGRELIVNWTPPKKFNAVSEGARYKFGDNKIRDYLPGFNKVKVYSPNLSSRFGSNINVVYERSKDLFRDVTESYQEFTNYSETDLFFFRNDNVPVNLKSAARNLVFPLYHSANPSLLYLSSGVQLKSEKKYGAALNCLMSALFSSTTLLTSSLQKALIRQVVFEEIASSHAQEGNNHPYAQQLFKLGADLNRAFLNSSEAKTKSYEYRNAMSQIEDLCTKAEEKAKEIRGQKRFGGFMAALSVAGSVSTASSLDNTISSAFLDQAITTLTESFSTADDASAALTEQYRDIENKIDTRTFLNDEGEQLEIGKPVLAGEIYLYLMYYPSVVKNVLLTYSSDKPNLKALVEKFYAASGNSQQKKLVEDIYVAISELEARILNYELRNIPIPESVKMKF